MFQINYDEKYKAFRWIGYIDLLGVKDLIYSNKAKDVFLVYKKAIEEFRNQNGNMENLDSIWFSDSFILYSEDNSLNGYSELDHLSRWFIYCLIKEDIPVRGAISYGDFYCDKENNLFFGKPLVEAYEFCEAQDWLGLIICPSAEQKLKPQNIFSGESSAYVYTEIPSKKGVTDSGKDRILPACILSCWLLPDFQERFSQKLYQMMNNQSDRYKRKYKNTIDFLEKNSRYANV